MPNERNRWLLLVPSTHEANSTRAALRQSVQVIGESQRGLRIVASYEEVQNLRKQFPDIGVLEDVSE